MNSINNILQNLLLTKESEIKNWFAAQYKDIKRCFYSSVDIRDSGYKIVPVDTNLFPAGFNNLTSTGLKLATSNVKEYLEHYYPNHNKILIIPENHSRNNFYFTNIGVLKTLLEEAGKTVEIALITTDENTISEIKKNAPSLNISLAEKNGDKLITKDKFTPDLILINTDLTSGVPFELINISQPIIPDTNYGWYQRTKSKHFASYDRILEDFCQNFNLDKFLLSAVHHRCGKIDFKEQIGIECVAKAVDKIINFLQKKYQEYGIQDQPYVYIKAERGTYGMGIMTATSGEEIHAINKKIRNKMDIIKEGVVNSEVIIQEGIKTINKINGHPAEPLSYLVNGEPVDCFFRTNALKNDVNNLNSKGSEITNDPTTMQNESDKISAYNLIAKLASLAAAKE
jgi:glutamate--cysteine ligase